MKNLSNRKIVSNLLGISEKSYYRWKETRKIFPLLEKYFSDEDLIEFLETGKIRRLDKDINLNDVIPKLYKFQKSSLLYFYFLIIDKNIKDIIDFKVFIANDITESQKKSFIKFIKSMQYSYSINQVSVNTFAQEFKNDYENTINEDEIDFILKDQDNRDSLKLTIDFILSNQMYKT